MCGVGGWGGGGGAINFYKKIRRVNLPETSIVNIIMQISVAVEGGGGGVITWGQLWYGCASQYFKAYLIHIPGI